jgi:hypothetical protein
VTASLVGRVRKTRAQSAPAQEVQEVVAQSVQAQDPAPFRYSVQWAIKHPKDGLLQGDTESRQSDSTVESCLEHFNGLLDSGCKETPNHLLIRKQLLAGYSGLTSPNWILGSLTVASYQQLLGHLQEWHAEGKRHLTLKAHAFVRDFTMADVTASAASTTPAASATPTSTQATTTAPTPRNTATNRQLAAAPAEREVMEVGGNWASEITARWTCTQRSCAFHNKGCCYWTGSDSATYHVPIIPAVLTAWAEGVRDKKLTAAAPSQEMYGLMMAAKYERVQSQSKGRGPGVVVNNYPALLPPPALMSRDSTSSSQSRSKKHTGSSPMRMPSDPPLELSAMEVLDAFFAWCKTEREWRTEHARLDEILVLLKANGDSVYTMANCSFEEWKDLNVANGYRKRLKMSAKLWINGGMQIVGAPPAGASA